MSIKDLTCLYSTVRNISAKTENFSFLPPHGRTMAPNEEYSMFGDIQSNLKQDFAGSANDRKIKAFLAALNDGFIEIVKNPHPILERADGQPRQLKLSPANTLIIDEPCWQSVSIP